MKKLIVYIILIVLILFILPIIFTKDFTSNEKNFDQTKLASENNNEINKEKANYQYSNYGKIKLLCKENGTVEEMNIDDYLLGVIAAEMPANYNIEALKAQAVVARTYTIFTVKNSTKHNELEICDNAECCQAWMSKDERFNKWGEDDKKEEYWSKIENAVNSTKGEIITYNNEPIDALFHANSGGKTERVSTVWGGTDLPYLQSVGTSGEDAYSQYKSEVSLTKQEFENKIKSKYQEFAIDYNDNKCIEIVEYTSGNRVRTIRIGNINISGVEARELLGLKSANFETKIDNDKIIFTVKGYGHGVGMSQTGADALANQGNDYKAIIKHFYSRSRNIKYLK